MFLLLLCAGLCT